MNMDRYLVRVWEFATFIITFIIYENDHIGLIKRNGTEKLAYEIWENLSLIN